MARSIKMLLYVPLQSPIFELPNSCLKDKEREREERRRGREKRGGFKKLSTTNGESKTRTDIRDCYAV